jgi:hypothetical protein
VGRDAEEIAPFITHNVFSKTLIHRVWILCLRSVSETAVAIRCSSGRVILLNFSVAESKGAAIEN